MPEVLRSESAARYATDMTQTTTAPAGRTFHRVESRSATGVDGWTSRSRGLEQLTSAMAAMREWADEAPHLNWRVVCGSPFGDPSSPLVIHASRGAQS